ncbi:GLPGLI family protein [Flavobacterium sandaracinum]|uniref:GLPGLI family protein n=1 Tax=Flavobacterium sandaracinum TaxID=2541733 RepID=A0A4R5D510_9FLAO|nr:GLPGLI family protein [Flavobacterium sandaracinum]TDE05193.1 GLPGLI family protein [Flavobacterium sandaracinum]
MRKYLLILLVLICCRISAQKSVKITYEQKFFYSDAFFNQVPGGASEEFKAAFRKPKVFELTNNSEYSLFKSTAEKDIVIPSSEVSTATDINRGTFVKPYNVWILKDFTKMSTIKSTTVEGQEYYVEQPFTNNDLKYDKRTKVIDGYTCLSAFKISAKNDTIQYWYTQDIPIIDGPFTMSAIPGLVLSTESKKNVVYVTKIEFFDKKLVVDGINKKTPFVTELELKNKIEESRKPKSYTDEFGGKHETNTVTIKNEN